MIPPGSVIGIIGGGQLGKMTAIAAAHLGYRTRIFTPEPQAPALQVSSGVVADYTSKKALKNFASDVDVVTFEFENVPLETTEYLSESALLRPKPSLLEIAQHRLKEKNFVRSLGIKTADFREVTNAKMLAQAVNDLGPVILKTVTEGYDGKGQWRLESPAEAASIWKASGLKLGIAEKRIAFEKEISVIVARNERNETAIFPPAQNIHRNGILKTSIVPADIAKPTLKKAKENAVRIAEGLGLVGLLAVEYFISDTGDLLVNELAPRPHNSGHWTMDGCVTSQFEQLVRAITGLPLGSVEMTRAIRMENLLGVESENWQTILSDTNARLYLYGKGTPREGRKMGHVNYLTYA